MKNRLIKHGNEAHYRKCYEVYAIIDGEFVKIAVERNILKELGIGMM